jgi:hypothetical protein
MLSLELARTIHAERQREIDARSRITELLRSAEPASPVHPHRSADGPGPQARARLRASDRPG